MKCVTAGLQSMVKQLMNVATPTSNTVLRFWNCLAWRAESLEMLCKEVSAVTLIFLQHAAMLLIGIVRVPPGPLKSLKVLALTGAN